MFCVIHDRSLFFCLSIQRDSNCQNDTCTCAVVLLDTNVLVKIMKKLGYTQNNELTDTRLAIGYAAVAVAGLTAAYDYYVGFFEAFNWTALGLVLYLVLNLAYVFWIWKYEAGTIYAGTRQTTKGGQEKIVVKSSVPDKYTPLYKLAISNTENSKTTSAKAEAKFMEWFGINGLIVFTKFEDWVKDAVSVKKTK